MILRLQSSEGTKRVEVNENESSFVLFVKIRDAFGLASLEQLKVFKTRDKSQKILGVERVSISDHNLKHGDIIYVDIDRDDPSFVASTSSAQDVRSPSSSLASTSNNNIDRQSEVCFKAKNGVVSNVEDEVDIKLWNHSGLIDRPRDEKLCRHGLNAKCLHCTPLEPYDENYLKEQNIKHMSFHSYLRKMTRGVDKGKFAFLEDISCRIKPGCKEHAPWPLGICTKCQPNAVTLNRQEYRHVDNIVFENASIVERFLDYWRKTGHQRIGYLYGRYEIHTDVPLGIKAVVMAIYEPPQEGSTDGISLLPDPKADDLHSLSEHLGLSRVGWIFTDLVPLDRQKGTVKCVRGAESHFLSAQECILAGDLQNAQPNPCRLSPTGFFGSKIVTVCVTGSKENSIHMEGYQVSNQCMALVRDNCLLPTKDAPELGFIRETSKEQFVPDVFYKEKDKFGNEVTKPGRPLPIEYLLVDVPTSTPVDPRFSFNPISSKNAFQIGNRPIEGHVQDLSAVDQYLKQFSSETQLEALSDFHLLLFLYTCDLLPRDQMLPLLQAIKRKDRVLCNTWTTQSEFWTSLQSLLEHHEGPSTSSVPGSLSSLTWSCNYCTFENKATTTNCEMCGLPKSVQ